MTAPDPRLNEIQAITSEAVEAAAKVMHERKDAETTFGEVARAALEAAAPHMHAHLLAELRKAHEALEQVEKVLYDEHQIWAAICSNTCGKDIHGVDHVAISDEIAATIRAAVAAAKGDEA